MYVCTNFCPRPIQHCQFCFICVHQYTHTHTHTHTHTFDILTKLFDTHLLSLSQSLVLTLWSYVYTTINTCLYVFTQECSHMMIHMYIYVYVYVYVLCIYICIFVCVCVYPHTHTHTTFTFVSV